MATPHPLTFGALLRRHRVMRGLTQVALVERAGLSGRAIGDLERGVNRAPQAGTLDLLVEALQLSAEEREQFEAAAREPLTAVPPSRRDSPLHLVRAEEDEALPDEPGAPLSEVPSDPPDPSSSPAVQTFLIADVRGYTRFTQEHGDEAAARLAARFAAIVRASTEAGNGRLLELR